MNKPWIKNAAFAFLLVILAMLLMFPVPEVALGTVTYCLVRVFGGQGSTPLTWAVTIAVAAAIVFRIVLGGLSHLLHLAELGDWIGEAKKRAERRKRLVERRNQSE